MIFVLAWRNIWRNKRRSFITMSSIGFAVIFATMMMSVQRGSLEHLIDNSVKFYTGHYQLQNPAYWEDKTLNNSMSYAKELINSIESLQGVQAVSPRVESFALASDGNLSRSVMVWGIDPNREEKVLGFERKRREGKIINSSSDGVMIAEGLAEYMKVGLGDTLILISQGYHGANAAGLFAVEAILKFPNPVQNKQMVVMSLPKAQWFYALDNMLTSTVILLDDYTTMPLVEAKIIDLMDGEMALLSWRTMTPNLIQTAEMKYASSAIMILILYAVIGFGMFGTFLMMTAERRREFGILLAIGMKRFLLQASTFMEVFILSALGVVVGLAISSALITYFHYNPIQLGSSYDAIADMYGMEMQVEFSAQSMVFYTQGLAIFLIAFILGFYPVMSIGRTVPVQAIREG
jgi:ABC-type lipoprotein release transport system permease subunit